MRSCNQYAQRMPGPQKNKKVPRNSPRDPLRPARDGYRRETQTVKELPQPQPPTEFGFLKVKPEPIIVVT